MKINKRFIFSFVALFMILISAIGLILRDNNMKIFYLPIGLMGISILLEKDVRRRLSRKNILIRDNNICQYCGEGGNALTIDHIYPKFRGGKDTWENLVCACKNCNQKKGNRTPQEANMPLIKTPKRPNRIHYFQRYVKDRQADWRPYLFMEPLS